MFYVAMHFSDTIQKKHHRPGFFGMLHVTSFGYIACALISVLILILEIKPNGEGHAIFARASICFHLEQN